MTDAEAYPAKELVALYHERWELEIAYDELKTHMLHREEAIRSRTPDGVRQELWGIALAYNLVRLEMERAAAEARVVPTRNSATSTRGGEAFAAPPRVADVDARRRRCDSSGARSTSARW